MLRTNTATEFNSQYEEKVLGQYDDRSEKELDMAKKNKFLSKLITSIGNFSVQYNFQSISAALLIMSESVCTSDDGNCRDGEQAAWVHSTVSAVVFVGAILGQLTMGYLGDVIGRNKAMILTLSLVMFSAMLSAAAPAGDPDSIYGVLVACRFFLGIGAGGVYPLSATKAAEDAGNDGHGGGGVDVVAASLSFFWQIPGSMTPWLVSLLMYASGEGLSADTKWRLLLGLGAIPAFLVVCLTMVEMSLIEKLGKEEMRRSISQEVHRNSYDFTAVPHEPISVLIRKPDIIRKLIATGGGWFIYDVAYYGVSLFGGEILSDMSTADDDSVSSTSAMRAISQQQLIGLSLGIPACLLSILIIRYRSTKELQMYGFAAITIGFSLLASCYVYLRENNKDALFALYCLLLFSLSFGPNLSTFILPAETYPKAIRSTFNGISAAAGKAGAFAGVYLFSAVASASSYPTVMIICAIISVLGGVVTWMYVDHKPPASQTTETQPLLRDESIM